MLIYDFLSLRKLARSDMVVWRWLRFNYYPVEADCVSWHRAAGLACRPCSDSFIQRLKKL